MIRLAIFLIPALVVGCQEAPNEKATRIVRAQVESQLKDPDSVKFGESFTVQHTETLNGMEIQTTYVCGLANAKNSFGGYTGMKRYVGYANINQDLNTASPGQVFLETADDERPHPSPQKANESLFEGLYWNRYCTDDTHPPSYTAKAR